MWSAYNRVLASNPLITKMFTVATLCGIGDAGCQSLEAVISKKKKPYNFARTARMMTFGFVISGPVNHYWYGILERAVPGATLKANVMKTAADQFIFAPAILSAFFGTMSLMEGHTVQESKNVISNLLWPSMKLNWTVWPAAQMINFTFVPLQHRVGYVSIVLVFWNAVISYLHHKDHDEVKEIVQKE